MKPRSAETVKEEMEASPQRLDHKQKSERTNRDWHGSPYLNSVRR